VTVTLTKGTVTLIIQNSREIKGLRQQGMIMQISTPKKPDKINDVRVVRVTVTIA
jgi:hypothetical protein